MTETGMTETGMTETGMTEPQDLNQADLRDRAVAAASGAAPFDLVIENGQLLDVITGQLRQLDIGIIGPLIASLHPSGSQREARQRIDASGQIAVPGLIDSHMHIESSMITTKSYAEAVLPAGVTTIVWDPHEYANVAGVEGIDYALASSHQVPLRIMMLSPSCVPSAPGFESSGADFTADIIAKNLARPDIHGLAEVMSMQDVIDRQPRMRGIVQAALESGKLVCGHARGLSGDMLNAYLAAGIASDHELVSAQDLMAKLQAGLTVEMRGSHDHLLPEFVAALNQLDELPPTLCLCTDDVFADDLDAAGGLDDVVRRLVRYGMQPVWALRAASFNAARRLNRPDLGLLAPGRRADIVLCRDLTDFWAEQVLANGQPVAENGRLTVPATSPPVPSSFQATMSVRTFQPDDFRLPATGKSARIATIDKPRFTQWGEVVADIRDGFVACPDEYILMSIINRFQAGSDPKLAFLGEWGRWRGAFGTTLSHDCHNLTLFGDSPENLAVAANHIASMGGGLAVVEAGQVIADLPLPIAGLVSAAALPEVADKLRHIRSEMDRIVDWQPPYLVFKACFGASLVCNAGPHLSDFGIVDSHQGKILENPLLEILS